MKILLVHPDDSVEVGPWAETRWDLAIDLGWSGRHAYSRQSERLGFTVSSIYDLDHNEHRSRMREVMGLGLGRIVDSESIDWWDFFANLFYSRLEEIVLVSALAERIPDQAEIFATRPHKMLTALSLLLSDATRKREIKSFLANRQTGLGARFRRYLKAASTLRLAQMSEIAGDKWDSDYRVRRNFHHLPARSSTPAILLPSAYSNVTRAELAYARMLPHRRFLLVLTRPNGRLRKLPANVEPRWLAAYAPRSLSATREELAGLLRRWKKAETELFETNGVFRLSKNMHVFEGFPTTVAKGLGVRDAWREVLRREPITCVLSADENNGFTRIPSILARSRKVRTVFCEHGALNMTFGYRSLVSDIYLLRGEMARDYSMEWCGIPAEKIVVGGPAPAMEATTPARAMLRAGTMQRDRIVFYSEAYELSSGRTETFYAELLPELCSVAQQMNCTVIVKLHPFESTRMRTAIVDRVLSAEQRSLVEIREGPMTPDLFERARCSLTVESTVAVESTANGVPCFLCSWFDASWYEYGKQYAKYSAGHPLDSPQRIREIPQMLEQIHITETVQRRLHNAITPERLEEVLSGECCGS